MNLTRLLCGLLLLVGLFGGTPVRAEEDCSGTIYTESTCNNACTQDKCQDVSAGQDGSQFQCCPPESAAPELPPGLGPFALALVFIGLLYARKKWAKKPSPPAA